MSLLACLVEVNSNIWNWGWLIILVQNYKLLIKKRGSFWNIIPIWSFLPYHLAISNTRWQYFFWKPFNPLLSSRVPAKRGIFQLSSSHNCSVQHTMCFMFCKAFSVFISWVLSLACPLSCSLDFHFGVVLTHHLSCRTGLCSVSLLIFLFSFLLCV